ncbi:MAG: response regulator [Chitinivibrionales bacterium]|nr:response regulator [Chitinivibrionales bacterium]
MRIMSVDDSRATRQVIKNAVEVLGFDFCEAADGKEALELLERENGSIDLILLDWNMPVMSGLEMLTAMKSDERFKHIPVTMVTTEIERHKVVEAISKGAKNYVMKPFTQEDLIGKIMESLGMGI